ncbi:MAG: DUF3750 domain-containing protein, partial [Rhodospirillales bacterium]|nr:DUF3750 domain-containing protein [Rhodospirillales bacterium]
MRWKRIFFYSFIGLVILIAISGLSACSKGHSMAADWRTASRESAGIAPVPSETPEAVVQVYSARAFSWRGFFGVHTWIASKRSN